MIFFCFLIPVVRDELIYHTGVLIIFFQAFTVIAVYNTMIFAFKILPKSVKAIAEAKVSMKRLKVYS